MKRYKLLKDLPEFKAGDMFYIDSNTGNLCAEKRQGHRELVAYAAGTLEKFPDILTEWFEEEHEWKPWRAVPGEIYWGITATCSCWHQTECGDEIDDKQWEIGDYFQSKGETLRALSKLKAYTTVKRDAKGFKPSWEDSSQKKWRVHYNWTDRDFVVALAYAYCELGQVYFATEEDAERSLEQHRKEWRVLFDLDEEETWVQHSN